MLFEKITEDEIKIIETLRHTSEEDSNDFFDLQLLKEHLEADGFHVSFNYDEKNDDDDDELHDSITVSISYGDLKKLRASLRK